MTEWPRWMDEMPYDWWDDKALNMWLKTVSIYCKEGAI